MDLSSKLVIVLVTAALMEPFAWLMHRYVMHGFGWAWHKSHHQPHRMNAGIFERNDLYAVVFASVAIAFIAIGTYALYPLKWVGAGMTLYGVIYFVVHDGMVHHRWLAGWVPKNAYLKRLYQGHRLHHAIADKDNLVSLGFLWTLPATQLKRQVQQERRRQGAKATH